MIIQRDYSPEKAVRWKDIVCRAVDLVQRPACVVEPSWPIVPLANAAGHFF
jgi:hypothetical protein